MKRIILLSLLIIVVNINLKAQQYLSISELEMRADSVEYISEEDGFKFFLTYPDSLDINGQEFKSSAIVPNFYYQEYREAGYFKISGATLMVVGSVAAIIGVVTYYVETTWNPWISRSLMMFGSVSLSVGIPIYCVGYERRRNANIRYVDWLRRK